MKFLICIKFKVCNERIRNVKEYYYDARGVCEHTIVWRSSGDFLRSRYIFQENK